MRKFGKIMTALFIFALTASLIVFSPPAASAQNKRVKISDEEAEHIEGKIIRPEITLILQRSKMNYDALRLKESFLPKIIDSMKDELLH